MGTSDWDKKVQLKERNRGEILKLSLGHDNSKVSIN